MRRLKPINHGTWNGYLAHRRRGVPVCEECRTAQREYSAGRREQNQAARTRYYAKHSEFHLAYSRSRHRALERVAKAHPREFKRYLTEELERERGPQEAAS